MSLSAEMIRDAVAMAKKNAIKPKRVTSRRQAKAMTDSDPTSRRWNVGDEYFLLGVK